MKKVFKISGLILAIFALVTNLHTALFSFYGIKTNSLAGQVWAQSTSTDGDETSGDDLFWDEQTSGCYVTETTIVPVKTYANAGATASIGFTGNTVTGVSLGASGAYTTTSEYIVIYTQGQQVTCPASLGVCFSEACSYAPGTKASYIIINGRMVSASTSGN